MKDEVTELARKYGVVTPYTAYLIQEDEARRKVPLGMQSFRKDSSPLSELTRESGVRLRRYARSCADRTFSAPILELPAGGFTNTGKSPSVRAAITHSV